MTKVQIVPVEPTDDMTDAVYYNPPGVIRYANESARDALARNMRQEYGLALEAAPDPTENTELIERVARWLCEEQGINPGDRYDRDRIPSPDLLWWQAKRKAAKDLLKHIEGKG